MVVDIWTSSIRGPDFVLGSDSEPLRNSLIRLWATARAYALLRLAPARRRSGECEIENCRFENLDLDVISSGSLRGLVAQVGNVAVARLQIGKGIPHGRNGAPPSLSVDTHRNRAIPFERLQHMHLIVADERSGRVNVIGVAVECVDVYELAGLRRLRPIQDHHLVPFDIDDLSPRYVVGRLGSRPNANLLARRKSLPRLPILTPHPRSPLPSA